MKAAHERADDGAKRAAEHADRVRAAWTQGAFDCLVVWLTWYPESFLAEQFVTECIGNGYAPPPDARAWGAVIQRAARKGCIVKVGYAPAATSNGSPKVLWRRA
jgi:hypothetical protein